MADPSRRALVVGLAALPGVLRTVRHCRHCKRHAPGSDLRRAKP